MRTDRRAAVGALIAALLVLSGCSLTTGADAADGAAATDGLADAGIVVPSLTVDGSRLHPVSYSYRLRGANRRTVRSENVVDRRVHMTATGRLHARIVTGYSTRRLFVGAFSAVDVHGRPKDGGDQFECLAGARCRTTTRAGSLVIDVPVSRGTKLVIVRSQLELPDSSTLDVVWRFRLG